MAGDSKVSVVVKKEEKEGTEVIQLTKPGQKYPTPTPGVPGECFLRRRREGGRKRGATCTLFFLSTLSSFRSYVFSCICLSILSLILSLPPSLSSHPSLSLERIFYESLYEQNPESFMAQEYCVQYGKQSFPPSLPPSLPPFNAPHHKRHTHSSLPPSPGILEGDEAMKIFKQVQARKAKGTIYSPSPVKKSTAAAAAAAAAAAKKGGGGGGGGREEEEESIG